MRRLTLPLYGKILGWLVLNLALIVLLSYAFAARDRTGLNRLLTQSVQDRVTSIARNVGQDYYDATASDAATSETARRETLARDGAQYGAVFEVRELGPPGPPPGERPPGAASGRVPLPALPGAEVSGERSRPANLSQRPSSSPNGDGGLDHRPDFQYGHGPSPDPAFGNDHGLAPGAGFDNGHDPPPGPGFGDGHGPPPGSGPGGHSNFVDVRPAVGRAGYDVIVELAIARQGGGGPPRDLRVTAHVASMSALLRYIGVWGEIGFVAMILLASALFWWPFVWSITRSIGQLLEATRQMSQGRLEVRVNEARRDELGELATAVNSMAERLQSYVQGQRQFIADVAHEVISPIARMQIGLGILETQVQERGTRALQDVREDLEQMAEMLNELLLFSRSGLASDRMPPQSIDVRHTVDRVLNADAKGLAVTTEIAPDTHVMGHAALIERALSNLLRNARRYAAETTTPVEIAAWTVNGRVKLAVRDRGPGVSEAALARLGEPFFRPELSRDRATGGFGLGLAIVRRCAAACAGDVTFRNRRGGGFEAELDLPAAT